MKYLKMLNMTEVKKVQDETQEIVEVAQMEKNEEMNVEWRTEEKRVTGRESDTQL